MAIIVSLLAGAAAAPARADDPCGTPTACAVAVDGTYRAKMWHYINGSDYESTDGKTLDQLVTGVTDVDSLHAAVVAALVAADALPLEALLTVMAPFAMTEIGADYVKGIFAIGTRKIEFRIGVEEIGGAAFVDWTTSTTQRALGGWQYVDGIAHPFTGDEENDTPGWQLMQAGVYTPSAGYGEGNPYYWSNRFNNDDQHGFNTADKFVTPDPHGEECYPPEVHCVANPPTPFNFEDGHPEDVADMEVGIESLWATMLGASDSVPGNVTYAFGGEFQRELQVSIPERQLKKDLSFPRAAPSGSTPDAGSVITLGKNESVPAFINSLDDCTKALFDRFLGGPSFAFEDCDNHGRSSADESAVCGPTIPNVNFGPLTDQSFSDKFPFGIFGFVADFFAPLYGSPVAPEFDIPIDLGPVGSFEMNVDLSPADPYMAIVRLLAAIGIGFSAIYMFASSILGFKAGNPGGGIEEIE